MLPKPGKVLVLFALFALTACNRNKPAPSLTTSVVVHLLGTTTPTAKDVIPTYLLIGTAVPYPAPVVKATPTVLIFNSPWAGKTMPYPPPVPYPGPEQLVGPPGPTPTPRPTLTPSQTPIPSQTRIYLPTDSSTTKTPLPVRIVQLHMYGANTGWAIDSNGNIQRTTHGVQSWKNVSPPVVEGFKCRTASFLDANTAVAGCIRSYWPASGEIEVVTWRTRDAGQTWERGELLSSNRGILTEIQILMLDSDQGWMFGIGEGSMGHSAISFYNSQDGGMHWESGYHTIPGDELELWSYYNFYPYQDDFALASDTNGFFSNGDLYASKDRAVTWAPFLLEPPADLPDLNCTGGYSQCKYLETISAPRFTSSQDGVLIRRVYTKTEAVGEEFTYGYSIHQLPLPEAQYLYFTHNGGQTWVLRLSPASLGTVYFLDKNNGWFLGKSDLDPYTPTQLYQTNDGGETWSLIAADCPLPLGSEFQYADEQAGFAFDNYHAIRYYYSADVRVYEAVRHAYLFYTQDGGRTWAKIVPTLPP